MPPPIAVADFKTYFLREFTYGANANSVMDGDIQRAINEASIVFRDDIWDSVLEKQTAFYLLTAHRLASNLKSSGGVSAINTNRGAASVGVGPVVSVSVGGVSQTFTLPEDAAKNPALAGFYGTAFGVEYLALAYPRMTAPIFTVGGPTLSDGQ